LLIYSFGACTWGNHNHAWFSSELGSAIHGHILRARIVSLLSLLLCSLSLLIYLREGATPLPDRENIQSNYWKTIIFVPRNMGSQNVCLCD